MGGGIIEQSRILPGSSHTTKKVSVSRTRVETCGGPCHRLNPHLIRNFEISLPEAVLSPSESGMISDDINADDKQISFIEWLTIRNVFLKTCVDSMRDVCRG